MKPYGPCVSNEMVNGLQHPILFHVIYCKFIHKDLKVNYHFIGVLHKEHKIVFEDGSDEMKLNGVKFQKYLNTKLDYTISGQVKITVFKYINEILNDFDNTDPTDGGTKSSAAPVVILKVKNDCEKLYVQQAVTFHPLNGKNIICYQVVRLDTYTAISFLNMIVRSPYNYDWSKLDHIMHTSGAQLTCL